MIGCDRMWNAPDLFPVSLMLVTFSFDDKLREYLNPEKGWEHSVIGSIGEGGMPVVFLDVLV